jgi:triphosphatase
VALNYTFLKPFRHPVSSGEKRMVTNEASPQAETAARVARRLFRELQQAILQHEAGAVAGDVEAVHDMRVGIRRLRVALGNFAVCLPKENRRRLRASLEHLANALGGARDLDVMIDALNSKQANKTEDERAAIRAFMRRLHARRRRRHGQLVSYLQSEEYASFKREFQASGEDQPAYDRGDKGHEELQNEQAA